MKVSHANNNSDILPLGHDSVYISQIHRATHNMKSCQCAANLSEVWGLGAVVVVSEHGHGLKVFGHEGQRLSSSSYVDKQTNNKILSVEKSTEIAS